MKRKVIVITVIVMLLLAMTSLAKGCCSAKFYKRLIKREKIARVREYYTDKLTEKTLRNRCDDIIIEKIIGVVTNNKGDGKLLTGNGYINYRNVKGFHKGDVILTLCIYNPGSKATDDIVDRFDYIIDRTM